MTSDILLMVAADQHCGHQVGLTHPDFNFVSNLSNPYAQKLRRIRSQCWDFYAAALKEEGTPDILILNGDGIDGKGTKSGGVELLQPSVLDQVDILEASVAQTKCKEVYATFGTGYHVSPDGEDIEKLLVKRGTIKKIESHGFYDILGFNFDVKHHLGSSSTPHGRATALAKDMVWNILWSGDDEAQPLADVTLRSHVHYFEGRETWYDGRLRQGWTLPALQAMGSTYGARRCSGIVHFGFLMFKISKKEGVRCVRKIKAIQAQKATVLKLR